MPNGIIVIDKQPGWTSMDVCAKLRGIFREKRIGHAGTLDPMATGVLPILLGRAAKALNFLPDTDKEYVASFRLGERRDTGDITGQVVEESPALVSQQALEAALPAFRGEILQVPPMYSAVSVNGKRLYELARKGLEVERQARPVTVSRLELLSYDPPKPGGPPAGRLLQGDVHPGADRGHRQSGGVLRHHDRPAPGAGLRPLERGTPAP